MGNSGGSRLTLRRIVSDLSHRLQRVVSQVEGVLGVELEINPISERTKADRALRREDYAEALVRYASVDRGEQLLADRVLELLPRSDGKTRAAEIIREFVLVARSAGVAERVGVLNTSPYEYAEAVSNVLRSLVQLGQAASLPGVPTAGLLEAVNRKVDTVSDLLSQLRKTREQLDGLILQPWLAETETAGAQNRLRDLAEAAQAAALSLESDIPKDAE